MGNVGVGFDDEEADALGELPQESARGRMSKALGAISFRKGKAAGSSAGTMEVSIVKPNLDDILGITFEVPNDPSLKGVVVAQVHEGYLMHKAKKLAEGDVVHVINGVAVTTPEQGATLLGQSKGVIKLVLTRAGATPRPFGDDDESGGELGRGDKTRSFLPMSINTALSFRPGGKKKATGGSPAAGASAAGRGGGEGAAGAAGASSSGPAAEDESNTTVVVSCSQLIAESKRIVGSAAGLDETLDALYAKLKAKEVASNVALSKLIELVGQTTVEQVSLSWPPPLSLCWPPPLSLCWPPLVSRRLSAPCTSFHLLH